jgi:hypothetical protein
LTTGPRMIPRTTSLVSGQSKGEDWVPVLVWCLTLSTAPGLCCCPTLKLYASSSLDCTIRIWTLDNRLLRWAGALGKSSRELAGSRLGSPNLCLPPEPNGWTGGGQGCCCFSFPL